MRILVIGGTRFIGAAAVRSLHGMGHEVAVFHRGQEPHTQADLPAGVVHVLGDRRRIAEHAAGLRRLAPDVVLDMVAMTERDARDLVAALGGTVPRLVAISSQDVYRAHGRLISREPGPPDPVPLDEEAPRRERLYPTAARPHAPPTTRAAGSTTTTRSWLSAWSWGRPTSRGPCCACRWSTAQGTASTASSST